MILSIATGNMYRWHQPKDTNQLIGYCRELDIDGVELTYAGKEEFLDQPITQENIRYLSSIEYVSIHSPFKHTFKGNEESIDLLAKLSDLYRKVKAKNMIIHPDKIARYSMVDDDIYVSTENLHKKGRYNFQEISIVLEKNPKIGLCLDVCHAFSISDEETGLIVERWKDRISQVHLSSVFRSRRHLPMQKASKRFLKSIEPIKDLSVPIVLEADFVEKDLDMIKEDIRYVRNLLG